MPSNTPVKKRTRTAMSDLQISMLETSTVILEALADGQERRAKRLKNIADRSNAESDKKQEKGKADDRISTLLRKAEGLDSMSTNLRTAKLNLEKVKRQQVSMGDWPLVIGRVIDKSTGESRSDLHVSFCNRTGKIYPELDKGIIDKDGEFALKISPEQIGEQAGSLHLKIEDSSGKSLYKSPKPINYKVGSREYLEIALAGKTNKKQ